jgi:hypothetical protein
VAVLDAGRGHGAADGGRAVLAAETLGRAGRDLGAVIGAGVNGIAAAQDVRRARPTGRALRRRRRARRAAADELGAAVVRRSRRPSPPTCS